MSDEELVALELDDSLSPEEKEQQRIARQAILNRIRETQNGDAAIKNAMNEAHDLLSESAWQSLQKSQQSWETRLRGADINQLVAKGIPAADAYGLSAKQRAEWISMHTSWALLVDFPGEIGGYYHTTDGRTLEIYEMPDNQINLVLRASDRPILFTATGKFENDTAQLHTESNPITIVRLDRTDIGKITLSATQELTASELAAAAPFVEGVFIRYNPGEIDVFTP